MSKNRLFILISTFSMLFSVSVQQQPCATQMDCPLRAQGQVCQGGTCILPCGMVSNCPSDYTCSNGICIPSPTTTTSSTSTFTPTSTTDSTASTSFVNPTPLENVEVPVTKDTSYGNLVLAFGILLTIALVFAFGFWYYRRRQRRHNFHRLKTNLGTTPRNSVVSTGSAFTVATSSRALENNDFLDTDIMSQVDRTSFVGVESLTPTSSGAGVGTPTITVDSGSARQVSEQRTSELDELRDDTQLS